MRDCDASLKNIYPGPALVLWEIWKIETKSKIETFI